MSVAIESCLMCVRQQQQNIIAVTALVCTRSHLPALPACRLACLPIYPFAGLPCVPACARVVEN